MGIRSRHLGLFASLIVICLGIASAAVVAQENADQSKETGLDRASGKERMAKSRYEAALSSKTQEEQRVSEANARYAEEQESTPLVPRQYTVSLASPIAAYSLFTGLEQNDELIPETVFTWLDPPGSPTPTTADISIEDLGWPGASAEEMSSLLKSLSLNYLRWKLEVIRDAPGSNKKAQEGEIRQLISMVEQEGVPVFGFGCSCSPRSLSELRESVEGIDYRAVELTVEIEGPIWPHDRLRELVIQTSGHYGR